MQLAAWDRLPILLAAGGGGELTQEEAVQAAAFMRDLLVYCCVDPRVSTMPGVNTIQPHEIAESDWKDIVRWAMRLQEAEAVRPFRGQRTNDGGGSDGEAVFVQTVGIDGNRGPGDGAGIRPGGSGAAGGDGN
jgi:hypothetical protein